MLDLDKKKPHENSITKTIMHRCLSYFYMKEYWSMYTIDNKKRYLRGNQNTQVLEGHTTQWQKGRKTNTDLTSEVKSN